MRLPQRRRARTAAAGVLVAAGVAVAAVVTSSPTIRTQSQFVAGTPEAGVRVELDTTVYLPATTPAPAVLLAHGFGGSKADLDSEARSLAEHGYVVLAYTARGFGRSGGLIHLDAPAYEVADAGKLMSYLATLPQVVKDAPGDPRVGVAGSSYGGGLALLLGAYDKRVDAVGADITWNDLSQALFPNAAGGQPGVFKKLWAGELFASASGRKGGACGRFAPELCAAYQQAASTGEPDASILSLLEASSPAGVLSRISAPTLLSQGEQDSLFPLEQAGANARGIAANGTPVKVIWRSGGHDGGTSTSDLVQYLQGWFDPVLLHRGRADASFDITVPGSGISAATGRTVSQSMQVDRGFSSGRSQQVGVFGPAQTIYAPAGGSPAAVTSVPGLGGLLNTAATATGSRNLTAIPGQVAMFASQPLPGSLLVAGSSTATLRVTAHDASDATLFASVHHVATDGTDTLPAGLVSPIRLTGLTPVAARTVTVTLPGVVRNLPAGDRLVLVVATSDLAYELPSQPRSYTIALAGSTVAVATIDGRIVRAGQPWIWLLTGLAAMAILILGALVAAVRRGRRRRRTVLAGLSGVPVAIEGLVKEYGDGYRAVDDVTFRVERGQVVGLLGPNGAGKTTTLRVLMGLIRPTSGTVRVFGELVEAGAPVLSRIGAFIEGPGLLPHLSGRENLRLFWAATGRPSQDAEFDTALEIAGLGESVDRRVKTFSHGMRQRLAIAQAMLGLPEVLVLDEPTNGLDPLQIAEMREVLRRYAATGRTVVISSHLLAEVEQTCSHVVVMHNGKLVAVGSVAEIADAGGVQLAVKNPQQAQEILAAAGVDSQTVPARRSLEDIFIEMVGADE
ncbi:MAG TPA: alpha/beta fold hydrolase [Dermatophilaceae bacterium]|nr:alpha/beta fold hydrolase [Dermatophilaceae bacterium]